MTGHPKTINSLLTAFFLYLLFTGGYPSLFIITVYLLSAQYIFSFFSSKEKNIFFKKYIPPLLLMATAFILFCLPAIISFVQYLSFIDRGKAQPMSFVLENSMPPAAMFSFISPFATTAVSRFIQTDPLMRNAYIGLVPLLFVLYSIFNKQIKINSDARFSLVTAAVMFGMAWGSFFFLRQAAYYVLPLMNSFRHPALLRLFGIFFLLLFGAYSFNQWQSNIGNYGKKPITNITAWLAVAVAVASIGLFIKNSGEISDLFQSFHDKNIKAIITSFSFTQRLLVQLPFIFFFLLVIFFSIKNDKVLYLLPMVMLLDIFTISQFNVPVTVIGATSFKDVEKEISRNIIAFPFPSTMATINENAKDSYSFVTGSKLHYTKKIGRNDYYITPGNLSAQEKMYESPLKEKVFKKPAIYFEDDSSSTMQIDSFGANFIQLTATCTRNSKLVYLQNNYPGWRVFVDGKETVIDTTMITFMSLGLIPGKHDVEFQYHPSGVYAAWYVSLAALILFVLILIRNIFFKKNQ